MISNNCCRQFRDVCNYKDVVQCISASFDVLAITTYIIWHEGGPSGVAIGICVAFIAGVGQFMVIY